MTINKVKISQIIKKPELKESLVNFYNLVNEQQSECPSNYGGWPPKSRIYVDVQFKPLNRNLFVMNRQLKDGKTVEPTLVFCCNEKPTLMLNRKEFQSLMEKLPWIKEQLKEFYKKL